MDDFETDTDVTTLQTPRLIMKPIEKTDFDDLCSLNKDPDVMRFIGGVRTAEDTRAELERILAVSRADGFCGWAIRKNDDGRFVGRCGIKPSSGTSEHELLYAIRREYWGEGYVTEAAAEVLRHTFAFGVKRIIAFASPENDRSIAVMQRLHMKFEGRVSSAYGDTVLYSCVCADR